MSDVPEQQDQQDPQDQARHIAARTFREEYGKVVALLVRVVGDFERAEELAAEAFTIALERWPREGIPDRPAAWLTTVARNKALDRLRRAKTAAVKAEELAQRIREGLPDADALARHAEEGPVIPDDRLPLLFTCCHPALARHARVALTLRTLCGLTTAEIARAFLVPEPTMAQRLVRAKKKIRAAGIPYRVPRGDELEARLDGVLEVIYLVFNEGYRATSGDRLVRDELCDEALYLAGVLHRLLPSEPEVLGLLALMRFHHARRDTRQDADGDLVLLENQDRARWHGEEIDHGERDLESAIRLRRPGPYQLQAAIAALHATAVRAEDTDWMQIAALYARLLQLIPTPVVALNRAVAVAMATTPDSGLTLMATLDEALGGYHLLHAARADLHRRAGRNTEACAAYRRALELVTNEPERRFLRRRLDALAH